MKKISEKTWILLGIPAIFLLGSLMHFIYDLLGRNFGVGLFAPVNESVFEHMKMVPVPFLLWWTIYYLFARDRIDGGKWFTSALVSMAVSLIGIPILFYFYTGAFGTELIWVDIAILFASLLLGQLLGLHFYNSGKGISKGISLLIMLAIIGLFVLWTMYPPLVPMFKDAVTGSYGIWQTP